MSKKAARGSSHYTKIWDAGVPRHVCSTPSTSPSWTLDQPGTAKVGSGHTLTDRRDELRGVPLRCKISRGGDRRR